LAMADFFLFLGVVKVDLFLPEAGTKIGQ
jgi:hypothetical protein